MTKKYKILSNYIKDLSSETPNVESFLFTKDNISKYELDIDINSKPLKDKLIEVNTTLKFQDKSQTEKKSYFEVVYSSIVKIGLSEISVVSKFIMKPSSFRTSAILHLNFEDGSSTFF